jgi:hypothetical protein
MKILTALLLCGIASSSWGADAISPDQPDFTNGPDIVAPGRFQLETSCAWERQDGRHLRATPTLLRLGVTQDLELRLETDGWLRQREPQARGRGDLSLGVKWRQREGGIGAPALGWLLQVDTPSGSGDFKGRGLRPALSLLAQWSLPADWSLGSMVGVAVDRDDEDRRFTAGVLSASLGVPLGERLAGFVELAGQRLASARHGGRVVTLGSGLAWPLSDDAQLDAAVFRGLNRNTPDWAWTLGLSLRF